MTVIAGASLFGGVLLAGDTRGTYLLRNGHEIIVDHLQKILPLAPYVGVGYSGNVLVAGDLLLTAARQVNSWLDTNRGYTASVLTWLPRFFAWRFRRIVRRLSHPEVSFLIAAVLKGRPNVIERAKAVALMERFRLGQLSHLRNWLPNILVQVLMTPAETTHIALGLTQE